ncbi:MAG TPA: family 1 glycosylhydrolase [Candidatus Dormibacteraeota bacterium]|nr:family 1 glycosylhydrolase [Candidatus Dormibacteraeota bacterium]
MMEPVKKIFYWGASTASHQVEGNNYNQWAEWEKLNSVRLANEAEKKYGYLKNWDDIKVQAMTPENYISGNGIDHYNRFEEDFDLASKLNLNSLRFSIEWSRIEPKNGEWNQKEIDHYKRYILEMRNRGLEPFLNVWHWTEPIWFTEIGGFSKKKNLKYFNRFTNKIAEELLDNVNYTMVLNEPLVYATFGYLSGDWPPNKKNILTFFKVLFNLILAHKIVYKNFKSKKPSIQIGIAAHITNFKASKNNINGRFIIKINDYLWNQWFLNRIRSNLDFIGINHYFTNYFKNGKFNNNPKNPVSDMGWYMEPSSIKMAIVGIWKKYNKPIIISENGVADSNDQYRDWWINETAKAIEQVRREGVDIFGYLHWSLLDNFEWAYGWWPKFGLIEVDRKDMRRIVRKSAYRYADLVKRDSTTT